MDWFENLFGFDESTGYVQSMFHIEGDTMKSLANGREFFIGNFSTPSLKDLRSDYEPVIGDIKVEHIIIFNVASIHKPGATIQVASQMNCLEFPSPGCTPEDGITEYIYDNTQGPSCALQCPGATLYRNYFVFHKLEQGEVSFIGQTADKQINLIEDLSSWKVCNGYVMDIPDYLPADNSCVRVGLHENVEVIDSEIKVNQCFCSAVCCWNRRDEWEPYAQFILDAMYEGVLLATHYCLRRGTGNGDVYLTMIGGGAFRNNKEWIAKAMGRAIAKYGRGLQIYVCHYCSLDTDFVNNLLKCL